MAGQAAKKAKAAASQQGSFYGPIIVIGNVVYCTWLIYIWSYGKFLDTAR